MTDKQKLLALKVMLPVVADLLEDLSGNGLFKQNIKKKSNMLFEEIRVADDRFWSDMKAIKEKEVFDKLSDQLTNGEILLRKFLKDLTAYETSTAQDDRANDDKKDKN